MHEETEVSQVRRTCISLIATDFIGCVLHKSAPLRTQTFTESSQSEVFIYYTFLFDGDGLEIDGCITVYTIHSLVASLVTMIFQDEWNVTRRQLEVWPTGSLSQVTLFRVIDSRNYCNN